MRTEDNTDHLTWIVLANTQGEHSLWPACMPPPEGWREVGPEGDADACAAWVDAHWHALRPRARSDLTPAAGAETGNSGELP